MELYPLVFTFRDVIVGHGFFAGVCIRGHALLGVEKDSQYSMLGVTPGGIAGFGSERSAAFYDFRERYRSVLQDLADETCTFEQFHDAVSRFLLDTNDETAEVWKQAVALVRSGAIDSDLPRENAGNVEFDVDELVADPSANAPSPEISLAEAA